MRTYYHDQQAVSQFLPNSEPLLLSAARGCPFALLLSRPPNLRLRGASLIDYKCSRWKQGKALSSSPGEWARRLHSALALLGDAVKARLIWRVFSLRRAPELFAGRRPAGVTHRGGLFYDKLYLR